MLLLSNKDENFLFSLSVDEKYMPFYDNFATYCKRFCECMNLLKYNYFIILTHRDYVKNYKDYKKYNGYDTYADYLNTVYPPGE